MIEAPEFLILVVALAVAIFLGIHYRSRRLRKPADPE